MRALAFACVIAVAATPAMAAPWVRGFVVDKYEPAFYYGAKAGTMAVGTDCPKGTTPDNDYTALLKTAWRTDEEVAKMLRPATVEIDGVYNTNREYIISAALRYRGFRKDIDTWVNPFAAPDPGMQEVTGNIAEGFDLDGNAKTGFISPSGERGIDNNLYRVMGCGMAYRGAPYSAYLSIRADDKMLEGLFGVVIRVSGNQDPMNDDHAVVEIGYTPERIIKDATGKVVPDYSYRIAKSAQYTRVSAHIKNGVIETDGAVDIHMPVFAWFENNRGEIVFYKGRLRLAMNPDTSLSGLVGGYIDWRQYYGRDTFDTSSSAGTRETFYHENQLSKYYALKRNADGLPDPKTGQNMGISAAFRFTGVRAYVRDSSHPVPINEPMSSKISAVYRDLFRKASLTATIIADPPRRRGKDEENPAPAKKPQQTVRNDEGENSNQRSSAP